MSSAAYKTPSDLYAVDGDVLLWGPGRVAFTMTPEAAEETARRLLDAARSARLQQVGAFAGEQAIESAPPAATRARQAA